MLYPAPRLKEGVDPKDIDRATETFDVILEGLEALVHGSIIDRKTNDPTKALTLQLRKVRARTMVTILAEENKGETFSPAMAFTDAIKKKCDETVKKASQDTEFTWGGKKIAITEEMRKSATEQEAKMFNKVHKVMQGYLKMEKKNEKDGTPEEPDFSMNHLSLGDLKAWVGPAKKIENIKSPG